MTLAIASEFDDTNPNPKDAMGLARTFLNTHGWPFRLHEGQWWVWDGARYIRIEQGRLEGELWIWIEGLGAFTPTSGVVKNTIMGLAALCRTPVGTAMPSWFTAGDSPDPDNIIPFVNGLFDVDTGRLLTHTRNWFSPNLLPHSLEPGAECPTWEGFLDDVFDGDEERKRSLAQWFGYNLTPDTGQQKFAVLCGPPASGKSTTLRVLGDVLGGENVATPTLSTLWRFYGMETIFTKMAALIGDAHLENHGKATAILDKLKSVVGGDRQNVDRKGKTELANLRVSTKFTVAFNEMPQLPDAAAALRRRMFVIPFLKSFEGREDRGLGDRLAAELPGIVAWSIRGLMDLRACGCLDQPQAGKAVLEDFCRLGSPITEFLEECCVRTPDCMTACQTLWEAWREWCKANGHNPANSSRFGAMLKAADSNIRKVRSGRDERGNQRRYYEGVRLRGMLPTPSRSQQPISADSVDSHCPTTVV